MSQSNFSDYYQDDDSQFLEALGKAVLAGDLPQEVEEEPERTTFQEFELPPATQKRKWIDVQEEDTISDASPLVGKAADHDTYRASRFGGFGEYMRRKRVKLQIQNSEIAGDSNEGSNNQIFKGLSIYINGWTKPSVQDLRQLIVKHGGIFQPYLDKKALVTHIITCSLTPAKIREFKHMKVVQPAWLIDSVEIGYLLPWKNYMYVHEGHANDAQGRQTSLSDQLTNSFQPSPSKTTSRATISQNKSHVPDPLYTTDPVTRADAARVPGYAADESNSNARRVMADPEWRKAHTSISSNFIDGYYKNSRLHHLSTWKAELKDLVQEAQQCAESAAISGHTGKVTSEAHSEDGLSMRGTELILRSPNSRWKGKSKVKSDDDRVIMHCDFDCFFVAVGLVSRPELKGKPVVVCHSQGDQGGTSSTSEIASSSYEARKFGIRNGMSLQQAKKLCPDVTTIPYEFERYRQCSLLFYTVLMSHADDLQAVSVDEALVDVSTTVNELRNQARDRDSLEDPAKDFAETLRAEVRKATTCEISIGISHNILLARLATRRAKPGGSFHLTPDQINEFLAPLDISDLHGFGWSTKQKTQEKFGATTLGELAKKSKGTLIDALGKATGETLYNAVRGVDDRKLESDKPRKSVSCEINYGIRFENNEQVETFIHQMAVEVKRRMDVIGMVGQSITLKVMKRDRTAPVEPPKFLGHGTCDLFNKQTPLLGPGGKPTSDDEVIADHAWRLLKSFNFDPKELRGIGIQVQKLESSKPSSTVQQGQSVLSFKRSNVISRAGPSKEANFVQDFDAKLQENDLAMGDDTKPMESAPESLPHRTAVDLPSFSQVDRSVFDALPRELREELENEYKRRPTSPFIGGIIKNTKLASRAPSELRRSVTPGVFPQKPARQGNPSNVKRITQQLAPRSRATISPRKSALYTWAMRPKQKQGIKVSEKVLQELNLDPEVFFELPIQVQSEQLAMARILRDKGSIPEPPKGRRILKPQKHELPPDFVPYIAPKPKARYVSPPCLRQQGKGEKLYFKETDDVQRVVETWLTKYHKWAPREKDVEFLCKYLVQCVDRSKATDVGVERAVAVMKWWLVLLRRHFPASEVIEEDDGESMSQRDTAGEGWWAAFWKVKAQVDDIAKKRFGGGLAFK